MRITENMSRAIADSRRIAESRSEAWRHEVRQDDHQGMEYLVIEDMADLNEELAHHLTRAAALIEKNSLKTLELAGGGFSSANIHPMPTICQSCIWQDEDRQNCHHPKSEELGEAMSVNGCCDQAAHKEKSSENDWAYVNGTKLIQAEMGKKPTRIKA